MVLITFSEIFSLFLVTFLVGYIFSGYIKRLDVYSSKKLSLKDIKFSILVSAPAIILHELAHKFVAVLVGLEATFKAYYFGLGLGLILKLFNSPFLILAPAYVQISSIATPFQVLLTAFAGPFVNLLLWVIAVILLKKKGLKRNQIKALSFTKLINMWLFIFNMLPISPLDGSKVFSSLFTIF